MKFFRYLLFSSVFLLVIHSCSKTASDHWKVDLKKPVEPVRITDISKEFYGTMVPLENFKQKYPWFQGTVPDEDFNGRRTDSAEVAIYKQSITKIDQKKLNTELSELFAHIQHYFPAFSIPQVFLYSSALQGINEPIFYHQQENLLFIDISAFMGSNNANYKGIETYFQTTMNPTNILPKTSEVFAQYFAQPDPSHQKFIDQIVYEGKLLTLQDAFLPQEPDYLKIGYSPAQLEWGKANEVNIWNYFVENNLVFSDDTRLRERFISPGPFSKFYTEVDNDSSPRVGAFIGWQICKKFFQENPKTKLDDFLNKNAQEIFNQSNYKPKN